VVDFGDHQVFEGVTTYRANLTMSQEALAKGYELQFLKVNSLPENNFLTT